MSGWYVTRVPFAAALALITRPVHPLLRLFFILAGLVGMLLLAVLAVLALVVDIVLLPFRLLL